MDLPKAISESVDFGDGRGQITIETGVLAKQADGSVVVKQGKTMLLATAVSAKESKPDVDFMPLSVEYQEKFASYGLSGRFYKTRRKTFGARNISCKTRGQGSQTSVS
jgi:polyribonucleotide nucleotidyltransferase